MKTANNISVCLWFDSQAEEAAKFYTSVFDNAKITATTHYNEASTGPSGKSEGSVMTVGFEVEGFHFVALNGGPIFSINPSVSFFVNCDSKEDVDRLWDRLIDKGKEHMPLDKYPFAARYGWVEDRFGVSWQLIFGDKPEGDWRPKIIPSLLFTQSNVGKAEEAINFYTTVFNNAKVGILAPYPEDVGPAKKGSLAYGDFMLENTWLAAMDSGTDQDFSFTEGVSLMVHCDSQKKIDDYWDHLTTDGGIESQCGWLKDKYGVSWQIIPENLEDLLKTKEAVQAMMQMKKLDIAKLKQHNS